MGVAMTLGMTILSREHDVPQYGKQSVYYQEMDAEKPQWDTTMSCHMVGLYD